jgi:hypothetical protein
MAGRGLWAYIAKVIGVIYVCLGNLYTCARDVARHGHSKRKGAQQEKYYPFLSHGAIETIGYLLFAITFKH